MKYQSSQEQLAKQKNKNYESQKYQRSSSNSQLSMSPGHWKKYLIRDEADGNRSGRSSNNKFVSGMWTPTQHQNEQISNPLAENAQKKREDMIRRVKEIQDKVMPILKSDNRKLREEEDIGWQNRMEEKILKMETHLDSLQKTMQIQLEKRILEVEAKWQIRMEDLMRNSRTREERSQGQFDSQRRNTSELEETD